MTNLLRYMKEKSNYNTKEEAVEFLMNETNLTYEECSKANDFHIRLNKKNKYTIPVCREQQLRQFYNKTASEHLCVKA